MSKLTITLLIVTLLVLSFTRIYGSSQSLNAGIAIGISDACQMGYEIRGDAGFFAYCDYSVIRQ